MKIQTFRNKKGLIWGPDSKRIIGDRDGVLVIGSAEIKVSAENELIFPYLFYGATGEYEASFTDASGEVFDLGRVTLRGGRIVTPPDMVLELMELRCRADEAEAKNETLEAKIKELEGIFDTDALNFLIK